MFLWKMRAKEEFTRLDEDKANASSPRNISYEVFKKDSVFLNVEEYSQKIQTLIGLIDKQIFLCYTCKRLQNGGF